MSGMPANLARAKSESVSGALLGMLWDTNKVSPSITELTPMVVTRGGTESWVTTRPLTAPATISDTTATSA